MKLVTKIYLAFGFIMLVLAFVTASFMLQSSIVKEDVTHAIDSAEILRLSEVMEKAIIDAETGVRGFQISDNEAFLEPFYKGQRDYEATYPQLMALVRTQTQVERLTAIDTTFDHWLNSFAYQAIELQRQALLSQEGDAAYEAFRVNVVRAGIGRKIMDNVREQIATFEKQETYLKEARMKEMNSSLRLTENLSIALTVVCLIVGFFIIQVLVKAIRQRLLTMANMASEISEGDFSVRIQDERNDEISIVSSSLNVMAQHLETSFNNLKKTNSELDQFAYVVSHDLKAPLRAINSLAEWIEEDLGTDLEPDVLRNLELMRGRVLRMENLINGILDYSRIGRQELPKQHFSTFQLVSELVDSLAPASHVQVNISDSLPALTAEHILLQQVFANLISNAIKYNDKPHPEVTIGGRALADRYEFWVEDNGPGIAREYHQKIFGIFQTMEARDTKESTGVGLAIVKKILDEKGGSVRVESGEGTGSRFVFTWPKETQQLKTKAPQALPV